MSLEDKLPIEETPCPVKHCVYNVDGICDEPQINKGNGDAACHEWGDDYVLSMLEEGS